MRRERRLRRTVSSQRCQTLAQITTQLCSMLVIMLHILPGRLKLWLQAPEAMDPTCQVGTVQGHGGLIMV
ncbi:hypothetical protein TNCV_1426111 [Trichonephila clavipes]|nr:hypothetical protein TNCV_1426111 [Trichonephila clavipes]